MKELNSSIETLSRKTERLLSEYSLGLEKQNALEAENKALVTKVGSMNEELDRLREENKVLKMASAIKGETENISDTKRKISQMVREIDRCIAMLND